MLHQNVSVWHWLKKAGILSRASMPEERAELGVRVPQEFAVLPPMVLDRISTD